MVISYSKKLVEKNEFGEGKGSHKSGLLKIEGVTPELAGELFKSAAEFYLVEPWKYFAAPQIFTITFSKEIRYFSVTGIGPQIDTGIIMETDWREAKSMIQTGKRMTLGPDAYYSALFYVMEEAMPFDDLEARERYGWEVVNNENWPLPVCFPELPPKIEDMFRPKRREITWFEVATKVITYLTRKWVSGTNITQENNVTFFFTSGKSLVNFSLWTKEDQWSDLEKYVETEKAKLNALTCKSCGKPEYGEIVLKRCSNCKEKLYCSRECQTSDWPAHKKICKKVQ